MPSNSEPTAGSETLYPKLSPEESNRFLEDFKQAVKAGAVQPLPGNQVEISESPTAPAEANPPKAKPA